MRIVLAMIIAMLLPMPASAQRMEGKHKAKADQPPSAEQQKKKREAEQVYKDALKGIPDKAPPADPWKSVR